MTHLHGLQQFHSSPSAGPQQFHSNSTAVPQQVHNNSTAVPQQFHSRSTPALRKSLLNTLSVNSKDADQMNAAKPQSINCLYCAQKHTLPHYMSLLGNGRFHVSKRSSREIPVRLYLLPAIYFRYSIFITNHKEYNL